ncbi:hypothetical protein Zmor_014858 [Zophobas morio]|uniref:Cytochrome P450 n=2 Tax=Zophobas morio TaxID=2755281 RepID=A0AA38IIA8_9CUCU|nr:hypothetical protein Zmor_014858 [Zophobas morio]
MVFFAALLVSLIVICSIIWFVVLLNKNREYFKKIAGPPPVPFFGNVFEVSSTTDLLDVTLKFVREYGGLFKICMGPIRKVIVVSDYKFLEAVLSSTKILNKSYEYNNLRHWLGTGLLTSDGPKWKKRRRVLTPAFHFQILEQFIDVFESNGNKLIKKLRKKIGERGVDIYPFVTLCTLDIICESAMGTSINAQFDDNSEYVRSVKAMCKIIIERLFNILQLTDITFPLTQNYYIQKKSLNILHTHTNNVITRRREELLNKKKTSAPVNEHVVNGVGDYEISTYKNKKAFLDLLLEATVDGRPLTQEEIREEVDTFMFEGHDTTASAISFALYCLANNADAQKKAYEEQLTLFGENKSPHMSYAALQSMKYLEMVIKETLRLYPSVPFYSRETDEEVEINGISIPKGVPIIIFAYGIHRDPTHFKDPEKFNPSRFEEIDGKHPYSYIPFSAGPRNCIGQKFAMLEMKSTISKILRHFELQPASPECRPQLAAEAVLKSTNGIKISLCLRQ